MIDMKLSPFFITFIRVSGTVFEKRIGEFFKLSLNMLFRRDCKGLYPSILPPNPNKDGIHIVFPFPE